MKAYRVSVNLKLGLIVFAVVIAVASLWYTNRLVRQLREREQSIVQLWAEAQQAQVQSQTRSLNPYSDELSRLGDFLRRLEAGTALGAADVSPAEIAAYRRAVLWAQGMPPSTELNFIADAILIPNQFEIPAIITDSSTQQPVIWRNVRVPAPDQFPALATEDSLRALEHLAALRARMDARYAPVPIEIAFPDLPDVRLKQYIHYGDSMLIQELRIYPYIQLLFVGLFILVGYLGFSYVRRSEQSSLWVGMAKEAAHQLGTPISSLMGWTELLKGGALSEEHTQEALGEIENDIDRLRRVTSRFSDIGSLPKLEVQPLAPVVEATASYIRRRLPQQGASAVTLSVDVPPELRAPLNAELFEWVVENLLKNALDAMEGQAGRIDLRAHRLDGGRLALDVQDTGKGIDRRDWKNVFRPGYSTKKRGWGLGLSLAKRIVEDYHGGTLSLAQSRPGQGTTFRIELPEANVTRR